MRKFLLVLGILISLLGCDENTNGIRRDTENTILIGQKLANNQPTPKDIDYSLERYNLIRRAYWVNGQREKAINLPCPVVKPFGYIALILENGGIAGNFVVDGKVSSLNSFLTPDSEYYTVSTGSSSKYVPWLPDVDGSYGENDNMGIFFFTPDGKYVEWTGTYLYSDIPMVVENPIIKYEVIKQ